MPTLWWQFSNGLTVHLYNLTESLREMTPSKAFWGLLVLDAALCGLFIAFEPTYVFDWDAYMEQVALVRAGSTTTPNSTAIPAPWCTQQVLYGFLMVCRVFPTGTTLCTRQNTFQSRSSPTNIRLESFAHLVG